MTILLIWLIILAYLFFFLSEAFYLPIIHSPTIRKIKLKKTILEALFYLFFVGIFIYLSLTQKAYLYLLNHLLCLFGVLCYWLFRQPFLHIKEKGFIYYFVYIPFEKIEQIKLNENGVLIINQNIKLAFADISALEEFQHILMQQLQEHL